MKGVFRILIAAVFAFGAIVGCKSGGGASENDTSPVQIGIIVPQSGPASNMGISVGRAFRLAENSHLRQRLEDDQCTPKLALAAYHKLRREGVRLWAAACSGTILALAPLIRKDGGLLVTGYAGSSAIRDTGPEVIRFNPDAHSIAAVMAEHLKSAPERSYALLYEEQEYARSLADLLEEELGDQLKEKIGYRPDQPTYKAELLRVQGKGLEGLILIPVADGAAGVIYKELQELRMSIPVIGDVNLCDYRIQPADFGLSGVCWHAELRTKGYKAFLQEYRDTFDVEPDFPFYDAVSFDAAVILGRIIKAAGMNSQTLDVARLQREILAGQTGKVAMYAFESNGEVLGAEYLVRREF